MSRQRLEMWRIRNGRIRCYNCGKSLNINNVEYTAKAYPLGLVEFIPTCKRCYELMKKWRFKRD